MFNPNISSTFTDIVSPVMSNSTAAQAALEVRVGYLGLCVRESSGLWMCARSATTLVNVLKSPKSDDTDPLNLIWVAKKFNDNVIFVGLMFVSSLLYVRPHS